MRSISKYAHGEPAWHSFAATWERGSLVSCNFRLCCCCIVRVTFSLSTCELVERPHASESPAVLAFVVCFGHCMRGVPCSAACRCHSVDAICGHGRWHHGAKRPGDNVSCSRGLQAWCLATCSLGACKASRCRATCGYDLVNVISVQGSCS